MPVAEPVHDQAENEYADDDGPDVDEDDMPPPQIEAQPDVDAADEAAARRAMQIVSGLLQSHTPGAVQQHNKPHFQQQGQDGGRGGRKRRRRRGRRGRDRDGYNNQQPGQQGQRPQNQNSGRPQNQPNSPQPRAHQPAPVANAIQPAPVTETHAVASSEIQPTVAGELAPPSVTAEALVVSESAAAEVQNVAVPVEAPTSGEAAPPQVVVPSQQQGDRQNRPWKQKNGQQRWRESSYESSSVAPQQAPVNVRKVVLLNATEPGEVRVAILENGELAEIFMERKSHGQQAGNIYKGRVVNVEPSLQAAFVDLGAERNGFLHASDCIPPDGGYSDVLVKPQRPNRDQRDNRDSRNRERNNQPQQPRPEAQPQAVAQAVEGAAQNIASAPVQTPDQPAAAAQISTDVPAQGQPNSVPQPGINPQQQGNNQGHGGKRRRRRRGGRGRSGRGRPSGPAPMLAPFSANMGVNNSAAENSAPQSQVSITASAAQPDVAVTAPAATLIDPQAVQAEVSPAGETASFAVAEATESAQNSAETNETAAPPETRVDAEAPVPSTAISVDADADDEADEDEVDGDENESESAEVPAQTEIVTPEPVTPEAPAVAAEAPASTESVEAAPPVESVPAEPVQRFDDAPAETTEAEEEVQDLAEASAIHNSTEDAPDAGVVSESSAASVPAATDETAVKSEESESIRESAPIPAPGQPAPVLASPERRGDRGGRSGRERPHDRRYTIQEMLREGQEVLIQVAKEGIGQKGPALTTYLSMPGRYLVLMPAVQRLGVSKRIDNEEQRRALKDALNQLNPPDDMGVIVRTAGTGRSKDELQRDMDYLVRVWDTLKKKAQSVKAPALIYQEGDVVTRVFRDVITDDVTEIVIDDPTVLERAKEFLRETAPGSEHKLKLYSEPEPLFHKYGVEQQMQRLFNRKVNLKNGGSIVIEQTEALVAIDVNTGRFREKRSQDETILQTNLEAAREIARQLRLRDIGGLVMIDFIDMEIHEHRRRVERELKAHLARDKARINVLPVSTLGVVEMTRQRVRHSLRKTLFERCPHCSGSGHIKSAESIGLEMLRELKSQLKDRAVKRVKVLLNSVVAFAILNQFRKDLVQMEAAHDVSIEVCGDPHVSLSQMQVSTAKEGGEWVLKKVSEVDDYVRNS